MPGKEKQCSVAMTPVFSCRRRNFEAPDDATRTLMESKARDELAARGCDASVAVHTFRTNMVGTQIGESSVEELLSSNLTSNCHRYGNNVNMATHRVRAECSPMYDMRDAHGRTVRNTNLKVTATLSACGVGDDDMPQIYEDLQKVAAANLKDSTGLEVDKPEHMACSFLSMPNY